MNICYLVGAGNFNSLFSPDESDLVIAADGGYDSLVKNGIRCDVLLGDLDSIKEVPKKTEIIRFPVRKDETDMHLAYLEGSRRGYSIFHIYGGTGGREDHTFANYCLLLYIKEHNGSAFLFSDTAKVTLIKNEKITLVGKNGMHLSLFPFGKIASGVSVKGAEYECEDITLDPSFPLCVSNLFTSKPAEIEVRSGALLIMEEISNTY